ncbi:hypothetical protein F2P81_023708 [Scophthalmus maximus]|uniref:Uncharacterized protein n=1 Tax=Scophthalmus maximus TaxID=52904 RepID=A0A6A4RSR2_SCOMX|nr:hypothetical protein F2P81_023708 [Scophthalmus maximus]
MCKKRVGNNITGAKEKMPFKTNWSSQGDYFVLSATLSNCGNNEIALFSDAVYLTSDAYNSALQPHDVTLASSDCERLLHASVQSNEVNATLQAPHSSNPSSTLAALSFRNSQDPMCIISLDPSVTSHSNCDFIHLQRKSPTFGHKHKRLLSLALEELQLEHGYHVDIARGFLRLGENFDQILLFGLAMRLDGECAYMSGHLAVNSVNLLTRLKAYLLVLSDWIYQDSSQMPRAKMYNVQDVVDAVQNGESDFEMDDTDGSDEEADEDAGCGDRENQ